MDHESCRKYPGDKKITLPRQCTPSLLWLHRYAHERLRAGPESPTWVHSDVEGGGCERRTPFPPSSWAMAAHHSAQCAPTDLSGCRTSAVFPKGCGAHPNLKWTVNQVPYGCGVAADVRMGCHRNDRIRICKPGPGCPPIAHGNRLAALPPFESMWAHMAASLRLRVSVRYIRRERRRARPQGPGDGMLG